MKAKKHSRRNFLGAAETGVAASEVINVPEESAAMLPQTTKPGTAKGEAICGPDPIIGKTGPIARRNDGWAAASSSACTAWSRISKPFGRCPDGGWIKGRTAPSPKAWGV